MDDHHAEAFGPYVLESVLGRGGMGVVYRARDTVKGRTVALKLLPSDLAGDAAFEARFRKESRIAAQLNDPHVVPIHDFGEIDGRLFIDMRLVDGDNLSDRLTSTGPMSAPTAVGILTQVAGALDDAHRQGLVHRDVKPANILLSGVDRPGRPAFAYLVDFGIARVLPTGTTTAQTSTATVGTVSYMAPERILGDPGDHRVDIYSLGCVLFECLAGHAPFQGEPAAVMYAQINSAPPDPALSVPGLPPGIGAVVAKAMAKDPDARYATAGEFADAATAALGHDVPPTVRVTPPPPPPPNFVFGASQPEQGARPSSAAALRTEPAEPARPPKTLPEPETPRPPARRRGVLLGVGLVALAAAGLAAFLVSQGGNAGSPAGSGSSGAPGRGNSSVSASAPPAPFRSAALYEFARPFFKPSQCAPPTPDQAKLATTQLAARQVLKCRGSGFSAAFWIAYSAEQLKRDRQLYRSQAIPGTVRMISGSPAGGGATSFQSTYWRRTQQGTAGRLYWQSTPALCAGEIQADPGTSLAAMVDFWHNGMPNR